MTSPQKRPFSHLPPSLVTVKTIEFAILNNRSHRFLEILLTSLPPSPGDVITEWPLSDFQVVPVFPLCSHGLQKLSVGAYIACSYTYDKRYCQQASPIFRFFFRFFFISPAQQQAMWSTYDLVMIIFELNHRVTTGEVSERFCLKSLKSA